METSEICGKRISLSYEISLVIVREFKCESMIFHFLRANPTNIANITVTGKRVNLGDREGLQIPCTISFQGEEKYIEILKKQLNLCPL